MSLALFFLFKLFYNFNNRGRAFFTKWVIIRSSMTSVITSVKQLPDISQSGMVISDSKDRVEWLFAEVRFKASTNFMRSWVYTSPCSLILLVYEGSVLFEFEEVNEAEIHYSSVRDDL